MITDNISDLITRIRNAYQRGITDLEVPFSSVNSSILEVLQANEFIESSKTFKPEGKKLKGIHITLKYQDGAPALSHVSRVSKSSLRRYVKADEIKPVLGGLGIYIISTPRGIMSSKEAKKRRLGGEVICIAY